MTNDTTITAVDVVGDEEPTAYEDCHCDDGGRVLSRRKVMAGAAVGAAATAAHLALGTRVALGATEATSGDVLVSIFLKGGVDGLSAVVPVTESAYFSARPNLKVAASQVVPLDGRFGLHPKLAPLSDAWLRGDLALVHAAGSPDASRSHFDMVAGLERGIPGDKWGGTGWIGRHLETVSGGATKFRAVSIGDYVQVRLAGSTPILATPSISQFRLFSRTEKERTTVERALDELYQGVDRPIAVQAGTTLEAMRILSGIAAQPYTPGAGVAYTGTTFGSRMYQVAKLVKAGVGVQSVAVDYDGWDIHASFGTPTNGRMATALESLGANLASFWNDLGEHRERVTVVLMSEFGRRLAENGTGGLDHGRGQCMFVLGGGINGGRVYGTWPGLSPLSLDRGDLAVTTDYRDVLAEVLVRRCGSTDIGKVFPGHTPSFLGLAQAQSA